MNREKFDAYCKTLKASTHVIQWRGASVWKVGAKIFAISIRVKDKTSSTITDKTSFKCSDLSFRILIEQPGIIPAPYLARAKWVQIEGPDSMPNADLKTYLEEAHSIISAKLTKTTQRELDLTP
jgi:predicted DNA-binding protein (MmcQ/YjbR family)